MKYGRSNTEKRPKGDRKIHFKREIGDTERWIYGFLLLFIALFLLLAVVTALLLISPIRMFALKFKSFGWRGNELRYSFIVVGAVLAAVFGFAAVPAIISLYIAVSTLRWAIKRREN